jgi:ketosteroid isomerase-like protein
VTQLNDLADVVRRYYDAFATGDVDAVEQMSSDDERAIAIGTDPDEWWQGGREIKAQLRNQLTQGQLTVKPGHPRIAQAGDVGWFADRPAFVMPDGQEIPCRLTGVLRLEGGEWKVIQSHASIGVPNAQAFGS